MEARRGARASGRRWRRTRVILAVLGLAVLTGASAFVIQPAWLADLLAWAYPDVLWRVETRARLVALTFDDGPAPDHTPTVLRILERHDARATFFLIGERAQRAPDLVRTLREGGHEIANHYLTLRSNLRASDAEFEEGLLRTEAILGLEGPVKFYRPPGGLIRPSQRAILTRHRYRCVLGSAYPFDGSKAAPVWYIRGLVAKNLAPGAIVILHDGIADPSRTLAALDDILVAGERKGLRFVPVGELLEHAGR
jgi:peptidoglycan/xylan/chitin deacetylase (PgdA/CDA1 family)